MIENNLKYADKKLHLKDEVVLDKVTGEVDATTGEPTIHVDATLDIDGATYKLCESLEWLRVITDNEDKVICGIKADGTIYINDLSEVPAIIRTTLDALTNTTSSLEERLQVLESTFSVVDNPEYIQVTTDSEDKVLEGITTDGVKKINIPVDNGAAIIESVDNPEYIEAKVDAEGRLIEGINKNGEKIFGVIPPQIKQYIDDNMPTGGSGVQSIEYEDATGDMYATYDDESGVTDVYMEPNGDIYVESEE